MENMNDTMNTCIHLAVYRLEQCLPDFSPSYGESPIQQLKKKQLALDFYNCFLIEHNQDPIACSLFDFGDSSFSDISNFDSLSPIMNIPAESVYCSNFNAIEKSPIDQTRCFNMILNSRDSDVYKRYLNDVEEIWDKIMIEKANEKFQALIYELSRQSVSLNSSMTDLSDEVRTQSDLIKLSTADLKSEFGDLVALFNDGSTAFMLAMSSFFSEFQTSATQIQANVEQTLKVTEEALAKQDDAMRLSQEQSDQLDSLSKHSTSMLGSISEDLGDIHSFTADTVSNVNEMYLKIIENRDLSKRESEAIETLLTEMHNEVSSVPQLLADIHANSTSSNVFFEYVKVFGLYLGLVFSLRILFFSFAIPFVAIPSTISFIICFCVEIYLIKLRFRPSSPPPLVFIMDYFDNEFLHGIIDRVFNYITVNYVLVSSLIRCSYIIFCIFCSLSRHRYIVAQNGAVNEINNERWQRLEESIMLLSESISLTSGVASSFREDKVESHSSSLPLEKEGKHDNTSGIVGNSLGIIQKDGDSKPETFAIDLPKSPEVEVFIPRDDDTLASTVQDKMVSDPYDIIREKKTLETMEIHGDLIDDLKQEEEVNRSVVHIKGSGARKGIGGQHSRNRSRRAGFLAKKIKSGLSTKSSMENPCVLKEKESEGVDEIIGKRRKKGVFSSDLPKKQHSTVKIENKEEEKQK
ncbi:hypothetical protein ADUPG1_012523 [Aduncisulcus paluster]|uniref:Uncharacterized protein n=1 Tax=Aduncisulcus paluster TaxID=2918883 RepID=A0ABQ5JZR6_9EUKA|nr:hypothetical protein ADUPG1_012523 [Aduncisulcus paluster]